jgi:hypothetical protein
VFERFTDRARRVLVLAQEEARLLNHDFIGTEHILLGLIHEEEGVAARTLAALGVSLSRAREKVTETIGVHTGSPSGSPPFTPRSKKVLELSLREALQLGHSYIGTEHLLLGLVREGEGVAAQVLTGMGISLAEVRLAVMARLSGAAPASGSSPEMRPPVGPGRYLGLSPGGGMVTSSRGRRACSFCGRDHWEVERYVASGPVTICDQCVAAAANALAASDAARGEVALPPRVFGEAPDDEAPAQVVAALQATFGPSGGREAIEDPDELEPYLAEAARRHPREAAPVRVARLRFADADTAEVDFEIGLADGPHVGFVGTVVRHGERWLVTRETLTRVLARGGVVVPPRGD